MTQQIVEMPKEPLSAPSLIAGRWIEGAGAATTLNSPYSGTPLGTVRAASRDQIRSATEAANAAFEAWRRVPIKERSTLLLRFRDLLLAHIDALSHSAAREAGKTVAEARAEVLKGVEVVEFAASLQNSDHGGVMEVSRGVTCEYRREPLGVTVGITPFNFPAMVPMWMIPIALAVGNSFILKPSDKVPFTACLLGELITEAGFPPGVFSVIQGGREAVEALIDDPLVRAVAFVGSTPIAKQVYVRATSLGKRALCLGGAKNHLIVVPDADPAVTVDGVVSSFTGCAGQRCMAASVMVAVGEAGKLVEPIRDAARKLELGHGLGAIIDGTALERLRASLDSAVKEGATLALDGRQAPAPKGFEAGNWLGASIIDNATPEMACARTELFGPILTVLRVKTLEEALTLDSGSPYGNATSIFTTNGAVARHVAERASSGMVGVNIGVPVPREPFSFGGTKESRFGYGDITGSGGVEFWSDRKKITTKWALQSDKNWMS